MSNGRQPISDRVIALPASSRRRVDRRVEAGPGQVHFSSIGNGSLAHLVMELVALKSGTGIVHVPFAGSSRAALAIIAGEAQMASLPALAVLPQVKTGRLRVLGVASAKRSSLLPDVPTLRE